MSFKEFKALRTLASKQGLKLETVSEFIRFANRMKV